MNRGIYLMAGTCAGFAAMSAFAQTPIARYGMFPEPAETYEFDLNQDGIAENPVSRDLRDAAGEGIDDPFIFDSAGPADDELFFLSVPATPFPTSAIVPPVAMFINGNDAGAFSYDASGIRGLTSGALFVPQDTYGQDLALEGGVTVEMFVKTNTDQSTDGEDERIQTLMLQAEGDLRYALILNESGAGELRWAMNDRLGTIVVCDLAGLSIGNGEWWYVQAKYDPSTGDNGQMQLTAVNEDGVTAGTFIVNVPAGFQGLPIGSPDNNTFFGVDAFTPEVDDPNEGRRFDGLMDEIQITDGVVGAADQLGFIPPDLEPPTIDGPIVRWDMVATGNNFPCALDLLSAPEEAGDNDLITFNGAGEPTLPTSIDVPPVAMFDNGNDAGSTSFDASAFDGFDGAVLYPQDVDGDVLSFTDAFSIEMFFKTNGDQSDAGVQQLLIQGEQSFRYGLVMNENAPGGLRFALNDNEDGDVTFITCDLIDIEADQNFADGKWHYLLAEYDPMAGEVRMTVVNENGDKSVTFCVIPAEFAGLPEGNDGNTFIGRNTFPVDADPRTFLGLIDEIQISNGLVPEDRRLGLIPTPPSAPGPIVYYDFTPAPDLPDPIDGANPITLDIEPDEGGNHIFSFNGLPQGGTQAQLFSSMVPPASLLASGVSPGATSFNAQILTAVDGAFFYPQDVYGNVLSFTGSFAIECFFKTDGDQSGSGVQQLLIHGEQSFRYGLVMNENGPGGMRFALNDNEPDDITFIVCDLATRNYADGQWHYVLAEYDENAGEARVTVLNNDGSIDQSVCVIPPEFAGLPEGNDGNTFIGRNTFPVGADPRTFQGVLDEMRFYRGIPLPADRLGALPAGCNPADLAPPFGVLDLADIGAFVSAFTSGGAAADLAPPAGVLDLSDISAFVSSFVGGCP